MQYCEEIQTKPYFERRCAVVVKLFKKLFALIEPVFIEKTPAYKMARNYEGSFFCPHNPATEPFVIIVAGKECEFDSSPFCAPCTEKYINDFGTICNSCGKPIFPGEVVALSGQKTGHTYTHIYMTCCPSGGAICGRWEEGKLVSLQEIDPKKYDSKQATGIA